MRDLPRLRRVCGAQSLGGSCLPIRGSCFVPVGVGGGELRWITAPVGMFLRPTTPDRAAQTEAGERLSSSHALRSGRVEQRNTPKEIPTTGFFLNHGDFPRL